MTSCFSTSDIFTNVFCSEIAILAAKGNSVKRCFSIALENAARILGEKEYELAAKLPKSGVFEGHISVNGVKTNCTVTFNALTGNYPEVN